MTRRDFLRLRLPVTERCGAEDRPEEGRAKHSADALREAFLRAMSAGVDPATISPAELVRRFSSEATSNEVAGG